MLYGWKLGCDALVKPIPTDGFNVEQIKYHGQMYIVWDLSGVPNYRPRWRQFYHGTNVLVIVLDINSEEGWTFMKTDIYNILQERDLNNIPCIVVFNKSDLSGKEIDMIKETNRIQALPNINIVSCCAKDDDSTTAVLDLIHKVCHNLNSE